MKLGENLWIMGCVYQLVPVPPSPLVSWNHGVSGVSIYYTHVYTCACRDRGALFFASAKYHKTVAQVLVFLAFFFVPAGAVVFNSGLYSQFLPVNQVHIVGTASSAFEVNYLAGIECCGKRSRLCGDRKSTRLNSSHTVISYAVFCLKK